MARWGRSKLALDASLQTSSPFTGTRTKAQKLKW